MTRLVRETRRIRVPPVNAAPIGPATRREFAAAGITDPALQDGYAQAKVLNAAHGKTYYLATLLLPAAKRPYVHALYGFARYADDIVDDLDPSVPADERAARFTSWSDAFLADLDGATTTDPICLAVLDTIRRWSIPTSYFADFLESMRSDLTVTEYPSYDALAGYMWGSAAVIGLQMLPILGTASATVDTTALRSAATDLGLAFQLTNFLRDVGEDLDRGRIYLPQDTLRRFGVTSEELYAGRVRRKASSGVKAVIAFESTRTRALYASAARGIPLVDPTSQDCLHAAHTLYGGILDRIAAMDFEVLGDRVSVGRARRGQVAALGLARAWRARRRSG